MHSRQYFNVLFLLSVSSFENIWLTFTGIQIDDSVTYFLHHSPIHILGKYRLRTTHSIVILCDISFSSSMCSANLYIYFFICICPANTSTLNQRWNNVDRQRSSTLFQCSYLVENESWADGHLSTLFQRWQNNNETILIELRRFNVDDAMLFQRLIFGWKGKV